MSIWFKVDQYGPKITTVEVVSETPKYVTIQKPLYRSLSRQLKGGEYFPTFAAARTALLDDSDRKFNRLKREMERERQRFSIIFMMDPPTEKEKETNETAT